MTVRSGRLATACDSLAYHSNERNIDHNVVSHALSQGSLCVAVSLYNTRAMTHCIIAEENAMTQNGTSVVIETKDESHLIIQLTQASYDAIREVVERATARGLDSGFEHWL